MICQCTPDSETTICVALKGAGESCGTGENFAIGCRSDTPCVMGADGSKCTVPAAKGESCNGRQCAAGFACDFDSYVCVDARDVGEPCSFTDPQPCVEGAYCEFDTDACEPRIAEGGECFPGGDSGCIDGTQCSFDSRTCVKILAPGAPCEDDDQCDGFCRDEGDGKRCENQTSPSQCGL